MTIKVRMVPHPEEFKGEVSGIKRVIDAYYRYLPQFDIEMVEKDTKHDEFDLLAIHAGTFGGPYNNVPICSHCHGLYFTADYETSAWEWRTNSYVINSIRHANEVTVPSPWVAEVFQRDMRFTPHIIPHGIEWEEWQEPLETRNHILWNKNRYVDVCDPAPVKELAERFPDEIFVSTFKLWDIPNVQEIGVIPFLKMKEYIKTAAIYLSTTKETFGIGTLEAIASGVPVLGFAWGGNLDLIEHGVNGYLAEPNNYDDLAEGLNYCLKHRKTLGKNGREMARKWTWEATCEKVAEVYNLVINPEPPTVSIVIPTFNYAHKVGRAIESAINQDYEKLEEIIVVDDGSEDHNETEQVVRSFSRRDSRVRYIHQRNSGVAVARNTGIGATSSKFVACLDADDKIAPGFLSICIRELENDRSLGIAYTGLQYIREDGSTGLSKWPTEFDYDSQLRKRNQVPTCCVFKREAWERVGGYRQKYAPKSIGAGSEDADFWTRIGSIGYGAKKVTDKGLFIYSLGSGYVTSAVDRGEYTEVDWLSDKPWVEDQQHPFASLATPKYRWSHAVRQYDEPLISVIIPVGPGHEEEAWGALDSLDSQSFRKWEVIVVWDADTSIPERLMKAFPFVKWIETDGKRGAGFARNRGVEIARGTFVIFLDADDRFYPQALMRMLQAWNLDEGIIYTDYVGKAEIDDIKKLAENLQKRVYKWDEKTHEAVIGYELPDYDPDRAQRQPHIEGNKITPWVWCNVTCLIPKAWHDEIGGFDEKMDTWEDLDYHYRMARLGKPYIHLPEELMVYQFQTGGRRDLAFDEIKDRGRQVYHEIVEYMIDKYKEIKVMACKGCGGGRSGLSSRRSVMSQMRRVGATMNVAPQNQGSVRLDERDFVKVKYLHPNRGVHPVIGTHPFPNKIDGLQMKNLGDGWRIDYGFRGGGNVFTIHRLDAEAQSHLYQIIGEGPRGIVHDPTPPRQAPEPPPTFVEHRAEPPVIRDGRIKLDLQTLPGITNEIALQLEADEITTREKILELGVDGIQRYKGVGPSKGKMIIEAIKAIE